MVRASGMTGEGVRHAVRRSTKGRRFGFLGEPWVNGLELRIELNYVSAEQCADMR